MCASVKKKLEALGDRLGYLPCFPRQQDWGPGCLGNAELV